MGRSLPSAPALAQAYLDHRQRRGSTRCAPRSRPVTPPPRRSSPGSTPRSTASCGRRAEQSPYGRSSTICVGRATCRDLPGLRHRRGPRRAVLPPLRIGTAGGRVAGADRAPRRHRPVRRPLGLHRLVGGARPGTRRRGHRPGARRHSRRRSPPSAATSTSSPATASWPSSAHRSPTRTTPNVRSAPRWPCNGRSVGSSTTRGRRSPARPAGRAQHRPGRRRGPGGACRTRSSATP